MGHAGRSATRVTDPALRNVVVVTYSTAPFGAPVGEESARVAAVTTMSPTRALDGAGAGHGIGGVSAPVESGVSEGTAAGD